MFGSARAKIARAEEIIGELETSIVAFAADEPCRFRVDVCRTTNRASIGYEITKPLPQRAAMLVADAIHNCRVPLDQAFYSIAEASGITDLSQVGFPCRDSKQKVVDFLARKVLQPIDRLITDAIVNDIRPYQGGNDMIWRLHCADIDDKHKLSPPTLFVAGLRGFSATCGTVTIEDMEVWSQVGRLAEFGAPLVVSSFGTPVFGLAFGHDHAFANQDIVKTLRGLVCAVTEAVDTLERVCLSTPACGAIP